jgi:hypothetical protein
MLAIQSEKRVGRTLSLHLTESSVAATKRDECLSIRAKDTVLGVCSLNIHGGAVARRRAIMLCSAAYRVINTSTEFRTTAPSL